MTNLVHMVALSGMGDTHVFLCSPETYEWIDQGGDAPEWLAQHIFKEESKIMPEITIEEVRSNLSNMTGGSSPDNDRALHAMGEPLGPNGEHYTTFEHNPKSMMQFVEEHGLELSDDSYEGYIY